MAKLVISPEIVTLWRTIRAIMAARPAATWTDDAVFMDASSRLHDLLRLGLANRPPFLALSPTPPRWVNQSRLHEYRRAHQLALRLDRAAAAQPARPSAPEGVALAGTQE
jgi:hypothetical protein